MAKEKNRVDPISAAIMRGIEKAVHEDAWKKFEVMKSSSTVFKKKLKKEHYMVRVDMTNLKFSHTEPQDGIFQAEFSVDPEDTEHRRPLVTVGILKNPGTKQVFLVDYHDMDTVASLQDGRVNGHKGLYKFRMV